MSAARPPDAAFFAQLFDAAPDAVVVVDAEGRIRLANAQVATLLGWSVDDLAGRPVEVLVPMGAKGRHAEHRDDYAEAPVTRPMVGGHTLAAVRADGTEVPVDISLSPIRHNGDTFVAAAIRDATERRAIEDRLSASEERMRTSLESMLDGFAILEAVREDGEIVDFTWTYINAVGSRTYKRPVRDVVGRRMREILPGIEEAGFLASAALVVETGRPWSETAYEYADETLDGVFELRAWKLGDGFAITWRDVADREAAAEALRLSEERFRESVEHLHDALSVFSSVRDESGAVVDFRWEFANRQACETTGYTCEELLGHRLLEVLPEHGPSGLFDAYRRVVLTGEPWMEPTLWHEETWGDGVRARRAFDVRATRLSDGLVVVSRDVTVERERDEREANELAALAEANAEIRRLNELGDLLQSCVTVEEAFAVGGRAGAALFPGLGGGISTIDAESGLLAMTTRWTADGAEPDADDIVFLAADCWALRRGQPHVSGPSAPRCAHLADDIGHCLCVPMVGQGDTRGTLHVFSTDRDPEVGRRLEDAISLATTVARQIAMAAANLRMRDQLRTLSIRDPLTGLFNRRYMEETLTRELSRAHRTHTQVTVVQLDIDLFKAYNDRFGHAAGDAVLVAVADELRQSFRSSDVVCRYGGEEFTVILPDCGARDAVDHARRLGEAVSRLEVPFRGFVLPSPTITAGVASFPDDATDAETLIAKADGALYAGKEAGRNTVVRSSDAFMRPSFPEA